MKVSTTQNAGKTSVVDPKTENSEKYTESTESSESTSDINGFLDDQFVQDDSELTEEEQAAIEAQEEFSDWRVFWESQTTGASTSDWKQVIVPLVEEILGNPDLDIDATKKEEFINLLETKYLDLKSKVTQSIADIKEALNVVPPATKGILFQVIEEREYALKVINEQLEKVPALKQEIQAFWEMEEAAFTEYGKEYYKWQLEYQKEGGGEYINGEPATLHNKPNVDEFGLDLNNDGFVGNPDSSVKAIATKMADCEHTGDTVEITDVINVDTGMAFSFDVDGNPLDVGSMKDCNYNVTFSHGNTSLLPKEEWPDTINSQVDYVFQLTSSKKTGVERHGSSEDNLFQSPFEIAIPEYIRVDEDGKIVGLENVMNEYGQNEIVMGAVDSPSGWELKRVLSVIVEKTPSITGEGKDHRLVIKYQNGDMEEEIKIQLAGIGDEASTNFAVSLIDGYENDEYKRTSGLHIDAKTMGGQAEYSIDANVLSNIEAAYNFTSAGDENVYANAVQKFNEGNKGGLLVDGFSTISAEGTNGNDFFLLGEPRNDFQDFMNVDGETTEALQTNALRGDEGFNAVFQKGGHLFADNFGLVRGGTDKTGEQIYIVPPWGTEDQDNPVYVELNNYNGSVEIANQQFPNEYDEDDVKEQYGHYGDDKYIIATEDAAFYGFCEPDVFEDFNDEHFGFISKPGTGDAKGDEWDIELDFLASGKDIKNMTKEQIKAHKEAIKDQVNKDELEGNPLTDYSDFSFGGEFEKDQEYLDNFFSGWSAWTGGFGEEDEDWSSLTTDGSEDPFANL